MTKHLNVYTLRDNKYTIRKCTRHFSRFYCRLSEGAAAVGERRERAERSVVVLGVHLLLPRPPPLPHDPLQLSVTSGHLEERNTGKNILRLFLFKTKNICFKSVLVDLLIPWVLKRLTTKWGGKKNWKLFGEEALLFWENEKSLSFTSFACTIFHKVRAKNTQFMKWALCDVTSLIPLPS